jgi:hypothetical protein
LKTKYDAPDTLFLIAPDTLVAAKWYQANKCPWLRNPKKNLGNYWDSSSDKVDFFLSTSCSVLNFYVPKIQPHCTVTQYPSSTCMQLNAETERHCLVELLFFFPRNKKNHIGKAMTPWRPGPLKLLHGIRVLCSWAATAQRTTVANNSSRSILIVWIDSPKCTAPCLCILHSTVATGRFCPTNLDRTARELQWFECTIANL